MSRMKNILITTTTFPRWKDDKEIPDFIYELCKNLTKKNKIIVLAPGHFQSKNYEEFDNLKIYRFTYFYPRRLEKLCHGFGILFNLKNSFLAKIQVLPFFISQLYNINRLIKKEKIDLIYANWIIPQGFIATFIRRSCNIPLVTYSHGSDVFPLKNKFFKFIQKYTLKNSEVVIINRFPEFYGKIKVIPLGINIKKYTKKYSKREKNEIVEKYGLKNSRVLLFVGRLNELKGVQYLIRALLDINNKFKNVKLLVIGQGPYKTSLEEIVKELNLQNHVIFIGALPKKDIGVYYNLADIFVLPSLSEGLGIVLLESILSGTPVIGTNVGGVPDIIKNNETGLLVEPENSIQISEAINKLLNDRILRDKLTENALLYIKNTFSWNVILRKLEVTLNEI